MSGDERDVAVVGGGPAGAAIACFLRRCGHEVVLLEAARFPRDKPCGEGISPEAWPLLEAMGAADRVRALRPHPLRGMKLTAPDGTTFRGAYRDRVGFALRRLDLDHALLRTARAAGVEVHEETLVTGLVREGAAVRGVEAGGTIFRARIVVGADGRSSIVGRRLGLLRLHPRLRRFAVRGYWEGTEGLGEEGEMHVGGGGYCGIAPLSPTLANVTFVLDRREFGAAGGDLHRFYRRALCGRWPRVAERLAGARLLGPPRAIGPLAVEARAVAVPGAVLVGDAAGFFDPFTGEGVTLALRTAQLAAAAIDVALRAPAPDPPRLRSYERARAAATRDKFRFNRLLQTVVAWPELFNLVARRLARRPDLADRLVGIAGDFVPARSAFSLRFLRELTLG